MSVGHCNFKQSGNSLEVSGGDGWELEGYVRRRVDCRGSRM
jgi:hypothetical protein